MLGVSVDILPLLQKAIFNLNCSYLKISVIKLQRYRLRTIILSELGHACCPRMEKGIYLVNLDEKIDMDNLKKAGGNVEGLSPPIMLPSGRKARHSLLTSWVPKG